MVVCLLIRTFARDRLE